MRVKQKYYRDNYLIGIYTNDDLEQCVAVLDNLHEFADYLHTNAWTARETLRLIWDGVRKGVFINKKKYLVYFININDFE